MIISVTFLVSILAILITVVLLVEVKVIQKHQISKYNSQIISDNIALNKVPDLNSILKINDAIQVLPSLYESRPDATRLSSYLSLITPAQISLTSLNINFSADTVSISGNANSINTINTFIDTLKFCEYTTSSGSADSPAFNQVVLSNYSYVPSSVTGQSFSITAGFSPVIFATKDTNVQLIVPNKITTRSDVDQPADLFGNSLTNNNGS
jgi:Tfp pilus assembly protein PilN